MSACGLCYVYLLTLKLRSRKLGSRGKHSWAYLQVHEFWITNHHRNDRRPLPFDIMHGWTWNSLVRFQKHMEQPQKIFRVNYTKLDERFVSQKNNENSNKRLWPTLLIHNVGKLLRWIELYSVYSSAPDDLIANPKQKHDLLVPARIFSVRLHCPANS